MTTELIVSAATSLTEVLTELAATFERESSGIKLRLNFAASGTLLQQVRQGAPIDLFLPASLSELDQLVKERRIDTATRVRITGNRLVLIAPVRSALRSWDELALPTVERVALSNPAFVPSGRYARETLQHRKLWTAVSPKAVFGENVRQTLAYVVAGDVSAGLVFATDAKKEKRVRVVATAVPGKDHTPIVYPAARITGCLHPAEAARFLAFLQSNASQRVFQRLGFAW